MAKQPKHPPLPYREAWNCETGFLLGAFTEADMEAFAGGVVPGWLQRSAVSLLAAQRKYTIRFEEQAPREAGTGAGAGTSEHRMAECRSSRRVFTGARRTPVTRCGRSQRR